MNRYIKRANSIYIILPIVLVTSLLLCVDIIVSTQNTGINITGIILNIILFPFFSFFLFSIIYITKIIIHYMTKYDNLKFENNMI